MRETKDKCKHEYVIKSKIPNQLFDEGLFPHQKGHQFNIKCVKCGDKKIGELIR